jgi:hypothetical protein
MGGGQHRVAPQTCFRRVEARDRLMLQAQRPPARHAGASTRVGAGYVKPLSLRTGASVWAVVDGAGCASSDEKPSSTRGSRETEDLFDTGIQYRWAVYDRDARWYREIALGHRNAPGRSIPRLCLRRRSRALRCSSGEKWHTCVCLVSIDKMKDLIAFLACPPSTFLYHSSTLAVVSLGCAFDKRSRPSLSANRPAVRSAYLQYIFRGFPRAWHS